MNRSLAPDGAQGRHRPFSQAPPHFETTEWGKNDLQRLLWSFADKEKRPFKIPISDAGDALSAINLDAHQDSLEHHFDALAR